MSSILLSLPELYNSYKIWVSKNPQSLGDWENSAKWISYFIAGRINNSHVVSELVYCLSNLLVMFNDLIIRKAKHLDSNTSEDKLKLWLTIVEYSEVFCELSAKKLWGTKGRWLVIVSIQVFKCICRLLLIYYHKDHIVETPPIPVLNRKNITVDNPNLRTVEDIAQAQLESTFTLKRSGRIVRKVDAAPPLLARNWKPPQASTVFSCENVQTIEQALAGRQLLAETIYITKPILHLASMACFGTHTWKPWMVALAMDLTSLQLHHSCKTKNLNAVTQHQRLQLSRRTVVMILYLIRSPVYEKYSKDKIHGLLLALSKYVPLASFICTPLSQYLPFWQSTYFYMWST